MATTQIAATLVSCDVSADQPCTASLLIEGHPDQDAVSLYAAERGWTIAGDGGRRCPRHRGA